MTDDVPVFFYGLFMDVNLLRDLGAEPRDVQVAELPGFDIEVPDYVYVVRRPGASVVGILATLSSAEVEALYDKPKYRDYRRRRLMVKDAAGHQVAAECYILDKPVKPEPSGTRPDYAPKLHALAGELRLPEWYVDRLGEFVGAGAAEGSRRRRGQ